MTTMAPEGERRLSATERRESRQRLEKSRYDSFFWDYFGTHTKHVPLQQRLQEVQHNYRPAPDAIDTDWKRVTKEEVAANWKRTELPQGHGKRTNAVHQGHRIVAGIHTKTPHIQAILTGKRN